MVMNEAIDLAIEGRSPYPDRAAFIDADMAALVSGQILGQCKLSDDAAERNPPP